MHIPVLLKEVIESLDLHAGEVVVDCNLNRGGHSLAILKKIGPSGTLVGIDLDRDALLEAQKNFQTLPEHGRICLMNDNFRNFDKVMDDTGIQEVDKVLFDLGLSSEELDISGRGFTFQKDEPLLMTFHSHPGEETLTAGDILNLWSEETLADIIFFYGDERYARRIAKAIVSARKEKKIETTFDLVEIIRSAVPHSYTVGKTHFATKTFQAIRIATNDEMEALKAALTHAFSFLKKGGRISVITFHSLEDRMVKNFFRNLVQEGLGELLYKKPLAPQRDEVIENPRARSSKLRTLIKV
jgi:16S rRNA (cytosine1402-N4)-methyltransferase